MKEQRSELTRSTQVVSRETRTRDLLAESSVGKQRRTLWIDGVGGYLLLDNEEILIGQAIPGTSVDVSVVGDLSRQAAAIRRVEGDYLLQPLQATTLDGVSVDRPQVLRHNAIVQFGARVKMRFRQPSPLSSTASLEMVSLNRFKPHVDGVLLLADACILGPGANCHVVCSSWSQNVLLFRHADTWYLKPTGQVEVNGQLVTGQVEMQPGLRMNGEDFSLSVE